MYHATDNKTSFDFELELQENGKIKSSCVRPFDLYLKYAIKYIRALLTGVCIVVIYNGSSLKI